jgi:hypothetical protein
LCYFTIQSNVLVIVACLAVACNPSAISRVLSTVWLTAVVCIVLTGVVYYSLLAADNSYVGVALAGDVLAHLVSPLLCLGTWIWLGSRRQRAAAATIGVLIFPLGWVVLTLIRGWAIGYYPYGFVDVNTHGYLKVVITVSVICLLAYGLARLLGGTDRRLPQR